MEFPVLLVSLAAVWGLAVGSFLNVIAMRGGKGESPRGRSRCESCGHTLSWRELLPVISFLIQKGRCRTCGAALSWQYLASEAGTAFSFAFALWIMAPSLTTTSIFTASLILGTLFAAVSAGVVIVISDLRFQIIPNGAVAILYGAGMIRTAISAGMRIRDGSEITLQSFLPHIVAAFLIALFFAGLWFFSQGRWIGFGDAKLAGATSLILGFPASLAGFLFSFWIGGFAGIILIASGFATPKSRIPFGPFILAGTIAAFFFSDTLTALINFI